MNIKLKILGAACLLSIAGLAQSAAIISDGKIKLGVDDFGQLNIDGGVADIAFETRVGMRYIDSTGTEYESTSHGCVCEGWGVGIAETGSSGSSNNDNGTFGLSLVDFTSTATTAKSVVSMGGELLVTHNFALSAESDSLYKVTVSIENTSAADISDLRYRRTFDWDTSPTPFEEFVSIGGTAASTSIIAATNDGFCSSDPFDGCTGSASGDFTGVGPEDQGANFDFGFGALLMGETFTFDIFYGATLGVDSAFAELGRVGAEAYSFGWSGSDVDQDGLIDGTGELAPTFIFAFAGVGGIKLPDPDPVNSPATIALLGLGIAGLLRMRKAR